MRVIAGSARRLLLKSPEGLDTRPTTDRIKETLFNMLMPNLPDAVFIDLFSGSGGIGIEALSRGANKAYFVENNQKAVACITENLEHTHLSDRAVVLRQDVFAALRGSIRDTADIIFLDPPYQQEYDRKVLELLRDAAFVTDDTLIVVEASATTSFDYVDTLGFVVEKSKQYKTNKHVFIKRNTQ
ncbi:MAG: 16S rRNA (guanine(966)-N(2))-methyltransferase RsmD [Lachnospiraceae bacterium]|nr:16S rRNA (guanine(966)-N(2))-methyltransferase RsmD [Lachnospiraceae bacterium]MCI8975230.1 16S rRNA (guanine(966)-N(2))-methyltransferase RsmD [Lachnospiraceae bacterium]